MELRTCSWIEVAHIALQYGDECGTNFLFVLKVRCVFHETVHQDLTPITRNGIRWDHVGLHVNGILHLGISNTNA